MTSECTHNEYTDARFAFDDPEAVWEGSAPTGKCPDKTCWMTCDDKVGKHVELTFAEPVAISRICTTQYHVGWNTVPAFDVQSSADGSGDWRFVWEAILQHSGPHCYDRPLVPQPPPGMRPPGPPDQ